MGLDQADEHERCFGCDHVFLDRWAHRVAIPTMSRHPQRVAAAPRYLSDEPQLCDGHAGARGQSAPDEPTVAPVARDTWPPMARVVGERRHAASFPTAGSRP